MIIPTETIPPQPVLILIERLDSCWERYRAELKRTRRDFANEYVHDLRISIRRLIAVLQMGRAVVQQKDIKKSRSLLKSQLDAFDELRDTQVQLTIVEELQEEFPEIIAYRDHLYKQEKRLISELKKKVKNFRPTGLAQHVAALRELLVNKDILEAESSIWSVVDETYSIVIQRQSAVSAEDTATIHRMRLTFKKFRYMVESLHPLLPDPPENFLRHLHDYQSMMGDIQDIEISNQMLAAFTAKNGVELPNISARLNEMRVVRISNFIDDMNELETFWRSMPDKKFPWQLKKRTPQRKARSIP